MVLMHFVFISVVVKVYQLAFSKAPLPSVIKPVLCLSMDSK